MKYLGIDYGTKRIGLAVSDGNGFIAFPRETLENNSRVIEELVHIIEAERIQSIVVGDTRALSGAANAVTSEAEAFVERLKSQIIIPVESVFEAWSSVEAARYQDGGEKRDDAAAAIILQRYLDMKGNAVE